VALGRVLMTVAPQAAWLLSGGRLRDERVSGQRENGWKMEQRIAALGRRSKLRRFP